VNKTAFDLLPYLQGVEAVKSSGLTKDQKDSVLREMAASIPAPVFCKACPETLAVLETLLGVHNVSPKEPAKEKPKETSDTSKQSPSGGEEKLLRQTDGNGRGKGASAAVVNKASKKRG
jgi:hypothetical protein